MDYKKIKLENSLTTRKIKEFEKDTKNIYESVTVISKRANQIAEEMKKELDDKLDEFATIDDSISEIFENKEQIEIAKYYERLPKPTLIAIHEFLDDKVYYRNPSKEEDKQ
jgi:DNA-directed RNA polymerase subunit K/omega